jgi:hypothetical protein
MSESVKRPLLMVKPELVAMIDDWERIRGSKSDVERRRREQEEIAKLPVLDRLKREISIGDRIKFVTAQKNRKAALDKEYEVLSKRRYCTNHDGGEVAILCDDGKIRGYSTRKVEVINPQKLSEIEQFSNALELL